MLQANAGLSIHLHWLSYPTARSGSRKLQVALVPAPDPRAWHSLPTTTYLETVVKTLPIL